MVHYFNFTIWIFYFNCLTLILIEKIGFGDFSNNSSLTFQTFKIGLNFQSEPNLHVWKMLFVMGLIVNFFPTACFFKYRKQMLQSSLLMNFTTLLGWSLGQKKSFHTSSKCLNDKNLTLLRRLKKMAKLGWPPI